MEIYIHVEMCEWAEGASSIVYRVLYDQTVTNEWAEGTTPASAHAPRHAFAAAASVEECNRRAGTSDSCTFNS